MSSIDFSKYQNVSEIESDIKSITIQGATNVAIATFEGIKLYINSSNFTSIDDLIEKVISVGDTLSKARTNEPLATNGVKYIKHSLKGHRIEFEDINSAKTKLLSYCDAYLKMISDAKEKIVLHGMSVMENVDEVLTHCHSSTSERLIIEGARKVGSSFKVVCTETRPLLQGRITARALLDAGLNTTLIADSSAESYIIGKGGFPVDVIFIGADEITVHGDVVNKIGSWGIALASYYANKPMYVVTPILKLEPDTARNLPEIEMRDGKELWEDAPAGLNLYNPAFELVSAKYITGYITELGVLKPNELVERIREVYPWVFE